MLIRTLASIALLAGFAGFTSCSGGSSNTGSAVVACSGVEINAMCLVSCNLGCSNTGCQITEIAQNQPLTFEFSQPIDPATVSSASVSIRTAQGEEPVGSLRVIGSRIEFVPEVQLSGGTSFFGFKAAETYVLTLQGGRSNINSLRATSGDPLNSSVSCSLKISGGIVDLNGQAPSAKLVNPVGTTNVSVSAGVVLEFSEVIDPAPFAGTTAADGPVRIRMRRTQLGSTGQVECNSTSEAVEVIGAPRVSLDATRNISVLQFQPATPFPGEVCVEIEVTPAVRDVAGTAAQTQRFQFVTEATTAITESREELFADETLMNRDASAGTWSGGRAEFGAIGGSGELGVFDPANGGTLQGGVYVWDTDNTAVSTNNGTVIVTDGLYEFSEFVLPAGATVRFVGSVPPQITATGRLVVDGVITVAGSAPNGGVTGSVVVVDRNGGAGGPGGGRGGLGALAGDGNIHRPGNNGGPGATVGVPAGHAYAGQVTGTGGIGARQFPLDGMSTSLVFTGFFTQMPAAGGGGGGFITAGDQGRAVSSGANSAAQLGPPAAGGGAFDILGALAKPPGVDSRDFFLVGGSGGGGGGSHALFSLQQIAAQWRDGAGGAGGGGAIALRAGDRLVVSATGRVVARGAPGNQYTSGPTTGVPSPGGGGAGGSILLQTGGTSDLAGALDVSGGMGGAVVASAGLFAANTVGGDGGDGCLRLEFSGGAQGNPTQLMPGAAPVATVANLGELESKDQLSSFTSGWYFTGQLFGPRFLRYEIDALVDGQAVTFSDDPAISSVPALAGVAPIRAEFQGAKLDPNTLQPQFGVDKPFRNYVGRALNPSELTLGDDGLNGYRFRIFIDRSLGQEVVLTRVAVFYQF